ncbi:MAG: tRNA 2-thiouridine(34) synthase MnmA [Parcubacteria group bacterium]|jgi:tRNA-specific 2-thiouridylase
MFAMNFHASVTFLLLENSNLEKKVIIALSGGVDSAVSAALLKKQGFQIVGVFFRFFDPALREGRGRTDGSLKKAKLVAEKLNIPLEIVDARKEFKKKIVNYFIQAYKKGITPNPCVVCNKEMKFRLLFELLKKYKADYIATGHYARIKREFSIFNFQFPNNSKISKFQNVKLLEAVDKSKDQSYFLYKLTQKELSKTIFPLGKLKKTEVKILAKKFKLPVFGDEESQDVCFLANSDISRFLKKNIKPKLGNIIDEKGNILACHKGLPFYTIGQRKGIEIGPPASRQEWEAIRASGPGPYFVVRKNIKKNEIVVTKDPKKLLVRKFFVNRVNWVNKGNSGRKYILKVHVQIRYHAPKVSAIIRKSPEADASRRYGVNKSEVLTIEAKKNLRAVTKGQSAVFYKNSEVLGGGTITS